MRKKEAFLAGIITATIVTAAIALIAYGCYTIPTVQHEIVNSTYKIEVYKLPDGRIDVNTILLILIAQVLMNIAALVIGYIAIED